MRLADKVIIVTGGGRGIGRAYSLALAAEGAHVVVATDIADPAPTVKEIEARGGQALGVHCDVSREHDALELATQTVARFGRIDVLVNNAALYGTLKRRAFMEIPVEEWDHSARRGPARRALRSPSRSARDRRCPWPRQREPPRRRAPTSTHAQYPVRLR